MKEINIITRSHEVRPNDPIDDSFYKKDCNLMIGGKILLPEWQTSIEHTRNGLFIIYKSTIPYSGGGFRLINDKGKDLLPYACDCIQLADPGAVYKIDKNGFNRVESFDVKKMIFRVRRTSDRKENFVKFDGTPLYPHWFDNYDTKRPDVQYVKHIKIIDDGLINYIDAKTGEPISKVSFEDRSPSDRTTTWENKQKYGESYVATVKYKGRWKVLLANGELL